MDKDIAALIVTISLTFIGFLATYIYNLRLARRNDRLSRVNAQLNEFYGPLYIATVVSHQAFLALFKKQKFEADHFTKHRASDKDLKEWRIWVENIFMPQNEVIDNIIKNKAHLLEEQVIPQCLLDFSVHVAGYRAVLAKWRSEDFSEYLSIMPFPTPLEDYARETYLRLKHRQLEMIGK